MKQENIILRIRQLSEVRGTLQQHFNTKLAALDVEIVLLGEHGNGQHAGKSTVEGCYACRIEWISGINHQAGDHEDAPDSDCPFCNK